VILHASSASQQVHLLSTAPEPMRNALDHQRGSRPSTVHDRTFLLGVRKMADPADALSASDGGGTFPDASDAGASGWRSPAVPLPAALHICEVFWIQAGTWAG